MKPIRLGVLAASPIYYQAPLYRAISQHPAIDFTAIFASSVGLREREGGGHSRPRWDVDAVGGYGHLFLRRSEQNTIGGGFLSLRDWDVARVIAQGRYDVLWLHGYNFLTHALAAVIQRLLGSKLLIREEQTLLHSRPALKAGAKMVALPLLFSQARALYIGTENRLWFTRYGVPPDRLHYTPYCVDNDRFREAAESLAPHRAALRKELGVTRNGGPVILTVARLVPKKQPLALLDAFARLRAQVPCTLVIVGWGPLEARVRARAAEIENVVVTGFMNQSEVVKAYACADIFALFSRCHETWGVVVNEAMNFSLPIVVSDKVGSATDLVREGINGFVVDHRAPVDLAGRLRRLVESADLRTRMGVESARAIGRWNYEVASAGVVDAVRASVGERRWREANFRRGS